jgi:hypothetical protein
MKKSFFLCALFGFAAIAAVPANAANSTFNFTSGTTNSDLSSYSVTVGGVTATAVAFYETLSGHTPTGNLVNGQVGEYNGNGLGICETQSGSNCSSPNHQVDNGANGSSNNYFEFMLIEFSTAVNLSQIQLGNFGSNGTAADPFLTTYLTSGSSSSLSAIESALETTTVGGVSGADGFTAATQGTCSTGDSALGAGNNGNGSYNDNCQVNGNGIENLVGTGVTYLLIGASDLTANIGQDYFKIQDLSFTSTPEPATFGLIGFALAGLGLIARKRKRN